MKNCYVDEKLKTVENLEDAKAIVAPRPDGLLDVLFFEPIAHNKDLFEHDVLMRKWSNEHYPGYRVGLPYYKNCQLANEVLPEEQQIKNCYTFFRDELYRYRTGINVALNTFGKVWVLSDSRNKMENVYVSILLPKDCFLRTNPDAEI